MATQLKDKPAGKHDAFIEDQLTRTQRRIRTLDLAAALLALAAGSLLFGAVVMLLDRAFELSSFTRTLALLLYLAAAGVFVAYAIVRPLRWKVNPRYAARMLEETLDTDRNHVVNWVDLRGEKLPGVIRSALGQRAAKDLSDTDPDRAVSGNRAFLAAGAFGVTLLGFLSLFFIFGGSQLGSLLSRAIIPFGKTGIPKRTHLVLLKPENGDAVVTIGQSVTIVARVSGRVPSARAKDAPCLLYRHDPSEPYRQRFLQPDEGGSEWAATVAANDVREGFYYKVSAGDAETPEYRITSRPAPMIRYFEAKYRHREYVNRADHTNDNRKLEGLQGTEVTLTVWTNREVAQAEATFDVPPAGAADAGTPRQGRTVEGTKLADDSHVVRFRFSLWESCKYHISFASTDGERFVDAVPYDVIVTPDHLPQVTITHPAKDVTLPPAGHLEIKGKVTDDIGVARVALALTLDGKPLRSIPYLEEKLGKPGFGTPREVQYQQLLELSKLRDADGKAVTIRPGMEIEYVLLSWDACDFRTADLRGISQSYKITIVAPNKDDADKLNKDRDEARKRQDEHDKNEGDRIQQEKKQQDEKRQKDQKDNSGEEDKLQAGREGGNENGPPRLAEKPESKPEDIQTRETADKFEKELNKPGEGKDEGKAGKNEKGKGKEDGKDEKGKQGEGKGADKKDGKEDGKPGNEMGGGKDGNASEGKDGQGEGKDGKGEGNQPSSAKPPPKDGKPGESKESGKGPPNGKEKGERKPDDGPGANDAVREGNGKKSDTEGKPAEGSKPGQNAPKDDRPRESKEPGEKGDKSSESKPGEGKNNDKKDKPGNSKSGDSKGKSSSEGKARQDKRRNPEDAKPEDVKNASDDLKHADPNKRQRAANDLTEMGNKAKDSEVQKAAKKAIEDAKKNGDLDMEGRSPGASEGGQNKKEEKGAGPGKPADKGEKSDQKNQGPGTAKDRDEKGGNDPGDGGTRSQGNSGSSGGNELAKKNQKPEKSRASMMQLEEFKKKVDKNVLQKMKMSPDQFAKFLRDYADLARRQELEKSDEKLPGISKRGNLPTAGGTQMKSTGDSKNDMHRNTAKPPPEYRESYNEFVRRLREQQK